MKKLGVLVVAVIMMVSFNAAKAQKFATVDMAGVLNAMPDKKKADDQLKAVSDAKYAEIKKQQDAAQAKFKQYQEDASHQTAAINQQREQELQKLSESLQQLQVAAQKDLAAKQDEFYAPIEKKIQDALSKVAKTNALDFIFDLNTQGLLYKSGSDVTADVKKALGL